MALTASCQSDKARLQGHWHLDSQKRVTIQNEDISIWDVTPAEEEIGNLLSRNTRGILDIEGSKVIWDQDVSGFQGIYGNIKSICNELVEGEGEYYQSYTYSFIKDGILELKTDTMTFLAIRMNKEKCSKQSDFFFKNKLDIDLVISNIKANSPFSQYYRPSLNLILIGKEKKSNHSLDSSNDRLEMRHNLITVDDIETLYSRRQCNLPLSLNDSIKNVVLIDKHSSIKKLPDVVNKLNKIDPYNIYLGFRKDTDLQEEFDILLEKWDGTRVFPSDLSISFEDWIRGD